MSGRRLTIFVQIRETLARRVADALPEHAVIAIPADGPLPSDARADVLLTLPWAGPNIADVLARGVRWVHALGTGVDAFPFHALGGQLLTCSRGGSAVPIAEWVLAVMLAFEKRLPEAWITAPPAEGWSRMHLGGLYGKTLGLVGIGGIGTAVAERARAFGMIVRAHRRTGASAPLRDIEVTRSLLDLVASADHLVLAAPATPATRHLLDRTALAVIKPNAHIVNIARGSLIDADALREALDAGRVAMASLDAVDPEPLPAGHWMYSHPRVRLSPHVSWNMPGAAELLLDAFIANVRRYAAGEPLTGVVDPVQRY
jgi:phosphoglycerate dehydrogenase-like enzyme